MAKKKFPFLSLQKVRSWHLENKPGEVLLAKLDDNTMPIRVVDDGVEQDVYLSFDEETDNGLLEIKVEMIDDLRFKAIIRHDYKNPDSQKYERIFTQPEKDAWIVWKETEDDKDI
jgi:hypothetical protein